MNGKVRNLKVSVLMATFNPKEKYFVQSIQSILSQTLSDFELVLIDDGSIVDIQELLNKNQLNDPRIKLYKLSNNGGLPKALNFGLSICTGEFIARMDDDDISDERRLEIQYEYLVANPEYVGCWTFFDCIDENDSYLKHKNIAINSNLILKRLMIKGNFLCHPTLFVKRSVINDVGGYDENLRFAQDNDLYIRILENHHMNVIRQNLLKYRRTPMRKNIHRDCLAESFVFFSKFHLLKRNNNNYKYKLWFCQWGIRLLIRVVFKL